MRQLRLIQGGKQIRGARLKAAGVLLYRAHSVSDLTRADAFYHDVTFNWYCVEREQPIGPYEELIAGYQKLDVRQRHLLASDLDRCLSADETAVLGGYLRDRFGLTLQTTAVALPITERTHLFGENPSIVYDFLQLSEQDGYPLPFKVWGYYTTLNCLTSPVLENGVLFLSKALTLLRVNTDFSVQQLEATVKALYASEGLFVKDGHKTP